MAQTDKINWEDIFKKLETLSQSIEDTRKEVNTRVKNLEDKHTQQRIIIFDFVKDLLEFDKVKFYMFNVNSKTQDIEFTCSDDKYDYLFGFENDRPVLKFKMNN